MTIPERQLDSWATLPVPGRSANTYESLRNTITAAHSLAIYQAEIHLQGSYANYTNIRSDSDVDIVAHLNASWRRDLTELTDEEVADYEAAHNPSSIIWRAFRRDVLAVLRNHYADVTEGNKCIKVGGSSVRLPADVLVAQQYRKYLSFFSTDDQEYIPGVVFWTSGGREVINYPEPHGDNGARKHTRTGNRYKPLVRAFKNARRQAVIDGLLERGIAPSYFVECLLYNVPNVVFEGTLGRTYAAALGYLANNTGKFPTFDCQNEVVRLFGSTPEQWTEEGAVSLITALVEQWNNW